MMTVWRYGKAQANVGWLVPPAVLAIMLAWVFYKNAPERGGVHQLPDLYPIFEYFLPLAAAFYLAGLPVFDRDEGAAETLLSYPQWPSLRILLLGVARVAVWLLVFAVAAGIASVWYYPVSARDLAAITLAPTVALSGAALVAGAVTRHQAGGLVASSLWLVMDLFVPGKLNQQFYLFRVSQPLSDSLVTAEMQTRNLLLLGAALWLAALVMAHRRPWWIR